ncbi:hypothetical protein [Methyloglobulus sp.]|uniref:hypothetical protein n=1 Tax=Methyloglobulus sp. TaxID=2518622 RepID=UPI0032B8388B
MVPFAKKNTLEQTGFKLTDDGFIHSGISYKFDEVVETLCYRQVFELKTLFIGSDFTHSIGILFGIETGEVIRLTEQPTWFSKSTLDRVEHVQNIFNHVSEKTFENRINKYTRQVEEQGFYEYSGWRFFPEQNKIIDIERKRAYSTLTTKFFKSYGFIKVVNEADGFGEKISNKFKDETGIHTLTNMDVFFALLKYYFNIEWK